MGGDLGAPVGSEQVELADLEPTNARVEAGGYPQTTPTAKSQVNVWGGWGSNPRPKDYEDLTSEPLCYKRKRGQ